MGSAGTTGNAQITMFGFDSCVFDNQTVVGDYAGPSASVAGQCTDLGSTRPASFQGVGRVTTLNAGAATAAIIDLGPWDLFAPGSTGAGQCAFNNTNAYFTGGNLACDQFVTDDGVGNMTMKSLGLTDATQAGFYYLKQGALPAANPANTRMDTLPTSVTAHTVKHPGTAGAAGQAEIVSSTATDANGNTIDVMAWGNAGASTEVQVNGVDTTAQTPINFTNTASVVFSNPGTGVIQAATVAATPPQIPTPSAPVATVNGTPGAATVIYEVVACEDSDGACTYHTPTSATRTVTTANATLTSVNSITLVVAPVSQARCYDWYRITGGPSQGKIASCAWTNLTDTGLAASAGSPAAGNTTALALRYDGYACSVHPDAPKGSVDALPCTPNALDDEFTSVFGASGDANNTQWTWLNQNSAVATLTNGALSLTSPTRGSDNHNCLFQPAPSTPYKFVTVTYAVTPAASTNFQVGLGLYESATAKLEEVVVQIASAGAAFSARANVNKWTSTTALTTPVAGVNGSAVANGMYLRVGADGTNVTLDTSMDGISWLNQLSETKTTFFTTAPNNISICIDNSTGANIADFDYFRRTQ